MLKDAACTSRGATLQALALNLRRNAVKPAELPDKPITHPRAGPAAYNELTMMTGQEKNLARPPKTVCLAVEGNTPLSAAKSTFGPHGWTIIFFQALMFWIAAGAVTHGLNVILPALSTTFHLDYNALLALTTPASWASIPAGPICARLSEKRDPNSISFFALSPAGCASACWATGVR
ncbi:hypothetical protein ABK905_10710 [Acerihabitans sp. KWT182]|uniref:MFS transporter n=1 Tax=Acerihabitans sp. KWT182 TaxID=3157919 RepID=A0AAU7QDZ3_9GAMM